MCAFLSVTLTGVFLDCQAKPSPLVLYSSDGSTTTVSINDRLYTQSIKDKLTAVETLMQQFLVQIDPSFILRFNHHVNPRPACFSVVVGLPSKNCASLRIEADSAERALTHAFLYVIRLMY